MRTGKIIQVSGSVVDVRFPQGGLPRIREALSVEVDGARRVMEVAQHLSSDTVRCIMLSGSEVISLTLRERLILESPSRKAPIFTMSFRLTENSQPRLRMSPPLLPRRFSP